MLALLDALMELLTVPNGALNASGNRKSVHDNNEHAAGRVLDERTRARTTPPPRRPTVEVPMADHNQVGANLVRIMVICSTESPTSTSPVGACPTSEVASGRRQGFPDTFVFPIPRPMCRRSRRHQLQRDDRRHDCDEKQVRAAPLRDVAAVEQCLLSGIRAVVSKQDSFDIDQSPLRVCRRAG